MAELDYHSAARRRFEPQPEPANDGRIPPLDNVCRSSEERDYGRGYLLGKNPIRIARIVCDAVYSPLPKGPHRSLLCGRKRCVEATHLAYETPKQNAAHVSPDVLGKAARKANAKLTPAQRSCAGLAAAYAYQRKHGKPTMTEAAKAGGKATAEHIRSKRVAVWLQSINF